LRKHRGDYHAKFFLDEKYKEDLKWWKWRHTLFLLRPGSHGIYYRKSLGTGANVIFKSLYLRHALEFFHRVFDIRNQNPMQVNCPFRVDHRHLGMETTYLIQILEMPTQKMQLKSMKSKSTHISMSLTSLIPTILTKTGRQKIHH
jgi:hypothetical protein